MVQVLDNALVDTLPELPAAAVLDAGQGHLGPGGLLGTQQSAHLFSAKLFDFRKLFKKPRYLPVRTDSTWGTGERLSRNLVWVAKGRSQIIFIAVFQDLMSWRCSAEFTCHRLEP